MHDVLHLSSPCLVHITGGQEKVDLKVGALWLGTSGKRKYHQTGSDMQAFEEGGGGARAVAHRILAEAKAISDKKPKNDGPDPRFLTLPRP